MSRISNLHVCLGFVFFSGCLFGAVFQTESLSTWYVGLASCGNQSHFFQTEKLQNTTESLKFYQWVSFWRPRCWDGTLIHLGDRYSRSSKWLKAFRLWKRKRKFRKAFLNNLGIEFFTGTDYLLWWELPLFFSLHFLGFNVHSNGICFKSFKVLTFRKSLKCSEWRRCFSLSSATVQSAVISDYRLYL